MVILLNQCYLGDRLLFHEFMNSTHFDQQDLKLLPLIKKVSDNIITHRARQTHPQHT